MAELSPGSTQRITQVGKYLFESYIIERKYFVEKKCQAVIVVYSLQIYQES